MEHEIADFEKDVLEKSHEIPVLVDFWAEWCGPCRMLGPILEHLAEGAAGRWSLAKVNTEAHPDVAQTFGITSIPNVKLFVQGRVVDEFVGALPEPQIVAWLESALPSRHAAAVAEARTMIERGQWTAAEQRLETVLVDEPSHHEARMLLGHAQLHVGTASVADTVAPLADQPAWSDRGEALATLARVVLAADDPKALPEAPQKKRFVEGARAVYAGDWSAALEAFIAVLRDDRHYADGLAREAGRAIFVLLGLEHPVVERWFRAFSSAVNV